MKTYNVQDYGALGNGYHNDTYAIQSAINEIEANKGGILFFPDGKYLCGSLVLCSNITLNCNNAILSLISDERYLEHIPFGDGNRYGENTHIYFGFECNNNIGFLCAKDKENICIKNIVLEADDRSFCERRDIVPLNYKKGAVLAPGAFFGDDHCYVPVKPRPQMLLFNDCKNIIVNNITINKSPCFSSWLLRCEDINIENTVIRNNLNQYNADGFHFSSCKNVNVSECDFVCGDDCIAIDTNSGTNAENFVIENCKFKTTMHAIRIYSGLDFEKSFGKENSGTINNVLFKNITINGCGAVAVVNAFDGDISNVKFNNISAIQNVPGTIYCFTAKEGTISDFSVTNSTLKGDGAIFGFAEANGKIFDIFFENTTFDIKPISKMWGVAEVCENANHAFGKPYNITLIGCENIKFSNCELLFRTPVFSDSFSQTERENIIKSIGQEYLAKIEPDVIPPVSQINSKAIDITGLEVKYDFI